MNIPRIRTLSSLLVIITIFFIIAIATQVFIDEFMHPKAVMYTILFGTLISSFAAVVIDIDIEQ